jgi:hypothetical protein
MSTEFLPSLIKEIRTYVFERQGILLSTEECVEFIEELIVNHAELFSTRIFVYAWEDKEAFGKELLEAMLKSTGLSELFGGNIEEFFMADEDTEVTLDGSELADDKLNNNDHYMLLSTGKVLFFGSKEELDEES